MFASQPYDIPGVPREVIEHHLVVCPPARPVKQKVRKQALERQEFIAEEIKKLEAACLVRGVLHPTWLANPVVVRKANGKWRLCIDFTDLNKACPKASRRTHFPCRASTKLWTPLQVVICSPFWTRTPDITRSLCPKNMKRRRHSSLHVVRTALSACHSD